MATAERFPFVQLELAGTVGLDPGRYLARERERVLVVGVGNAPEPARRRLRRRRPKQAASRAETRPVPSTTLTAIRAEALGSPQDAAGWLSRLGDDPETLDSEIAAAIEFANSAVHAHRSTALDPHVADVAREHALAIRVGFGTGDELVEGRWEDAVVVPRLPPPRRAEALRPTERVAEVLAGRQRVAACEGLLLRARGDLDAGRDREAALQLRVGLEALLAEVEAGNDAGLGSALAELEGRKRITGEAANEALAGELSAERAAEVTATVTLCERVLARRRLG